jgi:Meiotic cell cortex C-terminal pleckstrin homology
MAGIVTGVLDVKDDAPLMTSPSGTTLSTPVHNRSIVVLTPTQAIKFTAVSRERHISWLTALNFLVHNDPADLIIPRGLSPSNGSWREPMHPAPGTAGSISSSQATSLHQYLPNIPQHTFQPFPYNVTKNPLPDFAPAQKEETSPLGYKYRVEDEYATPPSVPRIPTGRRFEGRERSGSGSAPRDWDDVGRETIRMDAFVKRSGGRIPAADIDDNLFREF